MEYILENGKKVIVERDVVQREGDKPRKQTIGMNFTHGFYHGGMLSSFSESFDDEKLLIETGIGDIILSRIGDIKDAYILLKDKMNSRKINNLFDIANLVLEVVDEYFNGFANIKERLKYYVDEDFPESEDNKISNLKGKGAAMCVERSALAQNLLRSLGIKSFYKCSGIIKNGNKEVHAYNLIEYEGKYYILDTTMPNLVNDTKCPLICEIDKEIFDLISNPLSEIGCSVTTKHFNPYFNMDYTVTYDSGRKKQVEVPSYNGEGQEFKM